MIGDDKSDWKVCPPHEQRQEDGYTLAQVLAQV
jgi:hypothetical protein